MKNNRILPQALLCALSTIAVTDIAEASPWARPDGELLIIARSEYFQADLPSIDTGSEVIPSRFERVDGSTYAEYGLTNNVTLGGKVIYGSSYLHRGAETDVANGFSEIEAFGQYQVLRDNRNALSVRLAVSKPARFNRGVRTTLQANGWDSELAVLYGRDLTLKPVKVFTAVEAGYRKRFGDGADQTKLQLTLGIEPHKRILFLAETFGTFSVGNGNLDNDYDVIRVQPSVVYKFSNKWALHGGITRDIHTRNLESGGSYFIGLWSSF